MNNQTGAAYRKQQTNLMISGIAIIAFGAWSAVKLTMHIMMNADRIFEYLNIPAASASSSWAVATGFLITTILFSMLLHCFIGFGAIRDARGRIRRRVYIGVSALYMISLLLGDITGALSNQTDPFANGLFTAATYIIDGTSIIALIIILRASHILKSFRKQLGQGE